MTFPTTPILDAFDRANEPLSYSANWAGPLIHGAPDTLKIVSNSVRNDSAYTVSNAYWTPAIDPECEAYITVRGEGVPGAVYVFARMSNPGLSTADGYAMAFIYGEGWDAYLYRVDNGTLVQLDTAHLELNVGDRIGLSVIESTVTAYQEGVAIMTATDATYATGDYIGIGMSGEAEGGELQDFGGGSLATALASVTIAGLSTVNIKERYTYTSSYLPADASEPLTYTWSSDGLLSGQSIATAVYRWDTVGVKTVTLALSNAEGSVEDTHTVTAIDQKSLVKAIAYIQKQMLEIEGMLESQTYPPDKIGSYPFSTCYPGAGVLALGDPQGAARGEHSLVLEIHVARKDLPGDTERVWPFFDRVSDKLNGDETLGDTVDTIVGNITYQFTQLGYFGTQTIGWQFVIPIKQVRIKIGV